MITRPDVGERPHLHVQWSEGKPLTALMRYILLGRDETAPAPGAASAVQLEKVSPP